jgi:hypothetical protein
VFIESSVCLYTPAIDVPTVARPLSQELRGLGVSVDGAFSRI